MKLTERISTRSITATALAFVLGYLFNNVADYMFSGEGFDASFSSTFPSTRAVHVGNMCRCATSQLPIRGELTHIGEDVDLVQPPSKATGMQHKHFYMHSAEKCNCAVSELAPVSHDKFLTTLRSKYGSRTGRDNPTEMCNMVEPANFAWEEMPDLGVEEKLPVFIGALAYESPLSLEAGLNNWLENDIFKQVDAQDFFLQLNHRSEQDDKIADAFREKLPNNQNFTPMGSPEENIHPGRAIAKFCRLAEAHPNSHPNGENLVMFLEKDWHLTEKASELSERFRSINALVQRGVPYVRLTPSVGRIPVSRRWACPTLGVPWDCTVSSTHRWTNLPSVVDCKWFLRYMEPFALLDDPIMYGCRSRDQKNRYIDWEEALMDGRIAWVESQWTMASVPHSLFFHKEIDQ